MALQIYNTLTRKKEVFEPIDSNLVTIYLCGPTVYDFLHVGNFRGAIQFNLIRNWIEELGHKTKFIYNYTDVDDKIINRSLSEKTPASEIAEKYIREFEIDFARLGLRPHDGNPRVTQSLPEIIEMIQSLIASGHAYVTSAGDVNYAIRSFDGYGKLSNRRPDDMLTGVRIEKDPNKKDPLDFALWKSSKPEEPSWDSPWGPGRPGWHIECSAMAKKHLGEQIDIHGGGMDLIFPHHENEIAQSEGCNHKSFAKYWIHNNMIEFGGGKMSKSLGNVIKARDFMQEYHPEVLKYLMLSVHYRSVSDFSEDGIQNAIRGLARIYSSMALAEKYANSTAPAHVEFQKLTDQGWLGISAALNDDFNTPELFARVFEVVRAFNTQVKFGAKATPTIGAIAFQFTQFVQRVGKLMSLFEQSPTEFLIALDDLLLKKMNLQREQIDELMVERRGARAEKNFKRSDEIRDQLLKMGIAVQDSAEGSTWEVAK